MMKLILAVCALICVANAASIKWTGLAQNNQWTSSVNWYPAQVPGPNDDVTIKTGNVQVTIPTGCNSLTMGTSVDGVANLTVFQSFSIATSADIDVNGNLIINSGSANVVGTVTVKGHLYFLSGAIGGTTTITSAGTGVFNGGAAKNIVGGQIINQGTVLLSGVLGFNQSSQFTNQGTVTATDSLQLMNNDGSASVFDTSAGTFTYAGGAGNKLRLMVQSNFNTLGLTSGDVTSMDTVVIAADLAVPAGSTVKTEAEANTTFGGSITGDGDLNVGGKLTTFNAISVASVSVIVGVNTFNGAITSTTLRIYAGTNSFNTASSVTNLIIVGGTITFAAAVNSTNATVEGGVLSGAGGFSASTAASFASNGITLGTSFTLGGALTFDQKTLIAYATGGAILVDTTGSVAVSSPLTLTGPPGSGSFTNNGNIAVSAALSSANINLLGSGSYAVSGSVTTSSCDFSAGTVTINGGTVTGQTTALNIGSVAVSSGDVTVKIGNYSFACPIQCKNVASDASGQTFSFSS